MAKERMVAGIRCGGVLEQLSAYVDSELSEAEIALIEAHLRGCDWCEHFGGEFAETIKSLRQLLAEPEPLDESVAQRLAERLNKDLPRP